MDPDVQKAIEQVKSSVREFVSKTSPRDLYKRLAKSVIGQHEALKLLATVGYRHFENAAYRHKGFGGRPPFNNIILAGPTGVGKTFMVQTLAKELGCNFLHVDCSSLTASGYVGTSVEDAFSRRDARPTGYDIVLLDELDKLVPVGSGSDISTTSVQYELLRVLEGSVTIQQRIQGTDNNYHIDTTNMLFIGAGAFGGSIDPGKKKHGCGFGSSSEEMTINEQLEAYGFIPELIGRFTAGAVLHDLTDDDLRHIVTESDRSPLVPLIELFARDEKRLVLSDESLEKVIAQARAKNVGARGVIAAIEALALDVQFERLNDGTKGEVII